MILHIVSPSNEVSHHAVVLKPDKLPQHVGAV